MSSRLVNEKGECTGATEYQKLWAGRERGCVVMMRKTKADTAAMPCDLGRESGREWKTCVMRRQRAGDKYQSRVDEKMYKGDWNNV